MSGPPLSITREAVLQAVQGTQSAQDLAQRLGVAASTARRYLRRYELRPFWFRARGCYQKQPSLTRAVTEALGDGCLEAEDIWQWLRIRYRDLADAASVTDVRQAIERRPTYGQNSAGTSLCWNCIKATPLRCAFIQCTIEPRPVLEAMGVTYREKLDKSSGATVYVVVDCPRSEVTGNAKAAYSPRPDRSYAGPCMGRISRPLRDGETAETEQCSASVDGETAGPTDGADWP